MGWKVLFWNIQGTAKGNIKLDVLTRTLAMVKPDVVGFSEVGLDFPYDALTDYTFKAHDVTDKNEDPTPKGLAIGILKNKLGFESNLGPVQTHLQTQNKHVKLARPLLSAWVNGVEIVVVHAPSTGGHLGRVTVANLYDYLRDQCRLSKGTYKGFAVGDFNCQFAPYMMAIEESYVKQDLERRMQTSFTFYYAVSTVSPGWDLTQKSGGVLDFMITCGVTGFAERTHHDEIKKLNESVYLSKWPSKLKTTVRKEDPDTKLIREAKPELDSVYGLVKQDLDQAFVTKKGQRQDITGWHIDHRPIIYDIMNAERGPLAPRMIESGL
jgi:hypothetical protein